MAKKKSTTDLQRNDWEKSKGERLTIVWWSIPRLISKWKQSRLSTRIHIDRRRKKEHLSDRI